MKQIVITIAAALTCGLAGCQYETLPSYSGGEEIYFLYAASISDGSSSLLDSTIVHFGYDTPMKSDSIIRVGVRVQGKLTDYDRPVTFTTIPEITTATENTDFVLLPELSKVEANSRNGIIAVKLLNTARLDKTTMRVGIQLIDNEHFTTRYTGNLINSEQAKKNNSTQYKLLFDNDNEQPNIWAELNKMFNPWFGKYTDKKFRLICELCGLNRAYFTYDPAVETARQAFRVRFNDGVIMSVCRAMNLYFQEYLEVNGTPLLEDDGTEMSLGEYGREML